jgi:hypothetical protein
MRGKGDFWGKRENWSGNREMIGIRGECRKKGENTWKKE